MSETPARMMSSLATDQRLVALMSPTVLRDRDETVRRRPPG
jgi:hypothetical protein